MRRAGAVLGDHLHLPAKPSLDKVAQGAEGQDTRWSAQRGTNLTTEQEPARAFLPLPPTRAIYISTTFPPRKLTKTQQQLHFVAHWQVHFPQSQKTNHCKLICSTTWISQVHIEKSLIICAIAVEAKIFKRLKAVINIFALDEPKPITWSYLYILVNCLFNLSWWSVFLSACLAMFFVFFHCIEQTL